MVHNSSFTCGKTHKSCSGNCSLAHPVSAPLPQLHLDLKPCSEKRLTGSLLPPTQTGPFFTYLLLIPRDTEGRKQQCRPGEQDQGSVPLEQRGAGNSVAHTGAQLQPPSPQLLQLTPAHPSSHLKHNSTEGSVVQRMPVGFSMGVPSLAGCSSP